MVEPGRRMHLAFCTPKATNTHSEDVIVISFPRHNVSSYAPQCYVCTFNACLVARHVHELLKLTRTAILCIYVCCTEIS